METPLQFFLLVSLVTRKQNKCSWILLLLLYCTMKPQRHTLCVLTLFPPYAGLQIYRWPEISTGISWDYPACAPGHGGISHHSEVLPCQGAGMQLLHYAKVVLSESTSVGTQPSRLAAWKNCAARGESVKKHRLGNW